MLEADHGRYRLGEWFVRARSGPPQAVRADGVSQIDLAIRPLRILHATNDVSWNGTGHTNSTVEIAMEHAGRGHSVTVACSSSDHRMRSLLAAHGVAVVQCLDASSARGIIRSFRAIRPLVDQSDVLHVHTLRSSALLALAGLTKYVSRSVATLHNPHQKSAWLMCLARCVVTLNHRDARLVRRWSLGARRPTVINNGLVGGRRLSERRLVKPEPLPPNAVVFVGALHERKGLDLLLEAMVEVGRAVPDAHLHVVGNRDNDELERLAGEIGAPATFEGFSEDPRQWMERAAVFVLPSREEGFGNVLVEARECEVPIVATEVGGIPEALSGGRAGLLVPSEDTDALAAAITSVLTDPDLAADLRRRAAEGLDELSVEKAASAYLSVYSAMQQGWACAS